MARPSKTQIFAAGFNAHGQLKADTKDDLSSFTALGQALEGEHTVLYACWSTTVYASMTAVRSQGYQNLHTTFPHPTRLHCAIGDEDGLQACLDEDGRLYCVSASTKADQHSYLQCLSEDESPKLSQLARAGNGRVAISLKQAPNGNLCHILEFPSTKAMLDWFKDPSSFDREAARHHMVRSRPVNLVAGFASFVILMEDSNVYTWGDARMQSLCRPVIGEGVTAADSPGLVEALQGVSVIKVVCGGWLSAALSQDNAVYMWGRNNPGKGKIQCLEHVAVHEACMVTLPDIDDEELDIIDVAVGDDHIIILLSNQRISVVGDNSNGQLGLNSSSTFFPLWQEVSNQPPQIHHITTGPLTTYLHTHPKP